MVNDGPGGDGNYVSFREHADIKDRVTRLEASLSHVPAEIMRLSRASEKVEAAIHELTRELTEGRKAPQTPDAISSAILALHRAVEVFSKPAPPPLPTPTFPFNMTSVAIVAGGLMLVGALMGDVVGVGTLFGARN